MQRRSETAVIADQHEFYSAGLGNLMTRKTGLKYATARDLGQVIAMLDDLDDAALLVLDASLAGPHGADTVRMLRSRFPEVRILLTVDHAEQDEVFRFIGAGAHGVVSKAADSGETLVALRTVLAGHVFMPPSVTEQPKNWCIDTRAPRHLKSLTRRQYEIVSLMSQGNSNKVIARTLGISPSTVKVHLHAAFRALGVHSRVSAASAAFSSGPTLELAQDSEALEAKLAG